MFLKVSIEFIKFKDNSSKSFYKASIAMLLKQDRDITTKQTKKKTIDQCPG